MARALTHRALRSLPGSPRERGPFFLGLHFLAAIA